MATFNNRYSEPTFFDRAHESLDAIPATPRVDLSSTIAGLRAARAASSKAAESTATARVCLSKKDGVAFTASDAGKTKEELSVWAEKIAKKCQSGHLGRLMANMVPEQFTPQAVSEFVDSLNLACSFLPTFVDKPSEFIDALYNIAEFLDQTCMRLFGKHLDKDRIVIDSGKVNVK